MERPSRLPLFLGVVLVAAGWTVIFLGWYQSGKQDLETGQIPYVISGGFGGFGLLLMGVIAILVDVVRQAEVKLRNSATELHERLHELAESFVAEDTEGRRPLLDSEERPPAPARAAAARRRRRQRPAQRG